MSITVTFNQHNYCLQRSPFYPTTDEIKDTTFHWSFSNFFLLASVTKDYHQPRQRIEAVVNLTLTLIIV